MNSNSEFSLSRRKLFKAGLFAAGAAAVSLSGCSSETNEACDESDIIPKQTDIYKFSAPLVFNHGFIDEMSEYNKKYKKSQIDVLYNNVPWPFASKFNEWFQTKRGENPDIKSFNDFAKYAKHAMNNGFEVCYLLNSPKPFNDKDVEHLLDDLYKLLDDIYNLGIRNIKVANTQVAQLVSNYNKEFSLTTSVCFEYHNIAQYKYLLEQFPNIKRIVVTKDENQNFKFLTNLRKMFPDIELEMMLSEGCVKNCPSRICCMSDSETGTIGTHIGCNILENNPYIAFFENGVIYPWCLEYYSAIGINNFKLIQIANRAKDTSNDTLAIYMDVAEYGLGSAKLEKNIRNSYRKFKKNFDNVNLETLLSYFPDISYFAKNGHKCGDICGVECNYCRQKEAELKKFVESIS